MKKWIDIVGVKGCAANILRCCRGLQKTSHKLHWQFVRGDD